MRRQVITCVLLLSLVLAGCQQQQQENQPDATQAFIGGTTGLDTYLLEGVPPETVMDNGQEPFSYSVVLENKGESDIGPGTDNPFVQVTLQGVSPEQWGINDTTFRLNDTLRGARKNFDGTVLPGELTTVTFDGLSYNDNIRGNTEFTLRAKVCYDYQTISTTKLCVKDNVLEHINDDSVCSLKGEKEPRNSGGPVHVTSLTQNPMAEDKIQMNFVVEHVGSGTIYKREPGATCDASVTNKEKNWVHVRIKPLSDSRYSIDCGRLANGNQGQVQLFQGAPTTISCTLTRTGDSQGRIFEPLLEIELRYRYGQFIESPILVQDVSNEPGQETSASGDNS